LCRFAAYDVFFAFREAAMARLSAAAWVLGILAAAVTAGAAEASVSVKVKTVTYKISGKTGDALLEQMDRRGPKHGFMTHAIAQTSYTVSWNIDWRSDGRRCRVANAAAVLSVTYNFPEVSNAMPADLKRRWARFMAGVHKHEETHGRIAREMVNVAEKAVSGLSSKDDRGCRETQAEVKRRIADIYDRYEARQAKFDEVEHAEGGHVEGLVTALSGDQ
jgi:predicted secreted Zn-dependent protease